MHKQYCQTMLLIGLLLVAVPAQTINYKIDVNHSTIGFVVPIMGGLSKVRGKFTEFTVNLAHDESDITKSSAQVVIKAASINTGIAQRDEHLRTADFFEVGKFPDITFQSARIERRGQQLIAHGTFTMHGVAKTIALPFSLTGRHVSEDKDGKFVNAGYAVRWKLNRRDYGINWRHSLDPNFIGDEIEIEIDLITKAAALPK